jgi:hypothetical protein
MKGLGTLLASELFPEAEAEAIAGSREEDGRYQLLAGVRAESEERFLEAAKAVLQTVTWKDFDERDVMVVNADEIGPFELLGRPGFRDNGLIDGACDHFFWGDLVRLGKQAKDPDPAFGLAVLRALEYGDEKALAEVRGRMDRTKQADHVPQSDPVGAVRYARCLLDLAGATDEDRMRFASVRWGRGTLPAAIALAVAEARKITIDEPMPNDGHAATCRVVLKVALAMGKDLAEEVLGGIAGEKYMHDQQTRAFDVGWDEAQEVRANQQLFIAARLGRTVWSSYSPLEGNRLPAGNKGVRIASKRLPDEAKAKKELEKTLQQQAKKLGGKPGPRGPTAIPKKSLAKALFDCVINDTSCERVADLLEAGADPNGHAAKDKWTALHYATRHSSECVARLLAAGADPSPKTDAGLTPLDVSAGDFRGDTLRSTELLVAAGGRCAPSALLRAVEWGLAPKIALLGKAGGDPKAKTDGGSTAIDIAKEKRYPRTLKALRAL